MFNDVSRYKSIINKYWNLTSYQRVRQWLKIPTEIVPDSYVCDSIRIGNEKGKPDVKANRALLLEEIGLLNPQLIVLVGGSAERIIGKDYINNNKTRLKMVPFPTVRMTKENKAIAEQKYQELSEYISYIQNK